MGKPFKYRETVQEYKVVKKTLKGGKDDRDNGSRTSDSTSNTDRTAVRK